MNASTPVLRLRQVRLPLSTFTLEIDAEFTGPSIGIFGASGAGKTSLLDLVAGLRRAPSAYIEVEGRVFVDSATGVRLRPEARRVGYVPQDGSLFPHLNVRKNLLFGQRHRLSQHSATEGSETLFERVVQVLEIKLLLDQRIGELSGGERQRVALGRALLCSPRILLLDEPLASLDARLKARVLPYLQLVREEFRLPMLYVTHAPDEVMALCDDVLVLEAGRVIARGAPSAIFTLSRAPHFELAPTTQMAPISHS